MKNSGVNLFSRCLDLMEKYFDVPSGIHIWTLETQVQITRQLTVSQASLPRRVVVRPKIGEGALCMFPGTHLRNIMCIQTLSESQQHIELEWVFLVF